MVARWRVITRAISFIGLLALLVSCSSEEKLIRISGTVLCDGEPVPLGDIYFEPDAMKGQKGQAGFAEIRDGKFDTSKPGNQSVKPGAYEIRILGYDGKEANEAPRGQPIFLLPEFTEKRQFEAKETELKYDIPGKKKKKR
jgi:hypothetical protein